MTQEEVCLIIQRNGGKEYQDRVKPAGTRCFGLARMLGTPDCACNEKPPAIHVNVYADLRHPSTGQEFEGGVEFDVFGEAGDSRWLKATIHAVKREEVEELLPSIEKAGRAVWAAFVEAMHEREALSPRNQEE
jgi:hypothetical protein